MRILRRILFGFMVLLGLAGLLVGFAFLPATQTWLVERALNRQPGAQATVESGSFSFSRLQATNLRLKTKSGVLTAPALDVSLPLKSALWDRKLQVQSLVAKGWTLDFSGAPAATAGNGQMPSAAPSPSTNLAVTAPRETALAEEVMAGFRGLLGGGALPDELSLDGVTLEGDVLMPSAADKGATRVHVSVTGGGLTAGRSGEFALTASGVVMDEVNSPHSFSGHGRLSVTMATARTINRVELEGNLSAQDRSLPDDLGVSLRLASAGAVGGESIALALTRGQRRLVTLAGDFPPGATALKGSWSLDLRDLDFLQLHPDRALPSFAATGEGLFDSDAGFTRVHATGNLKASVGRLETLAPALRGLGSDTLEFGFDLTHTGHVLRIDRLTGTLADSSPIAVVQATQTFTIDERTGRMTAADPDADWVKGMLTRLPLAWLSGLGGELAFTGSDVTGEFGVRTTAGGFELRSKAPLVATNVSVQQAGRPLGQGLDLSLALRVEHTAQGWQMEAAPLILGATGRPIATIEARVAPLATGSGRCAITGTWRANLELLAAQPAFAQSNPMKGRSTSGDFSIQTGKTAEVRSTINFAATAPAHTVTASLRAIVDAQGGINFKMPVTITVGAKATSITAGGNWTKERTDAHLDLDLSGVEVALDHLELLGASLSELAGVMWPAWTEPGSVERTPAAGPKDRSPFWGDWTGRVKFDCYHLRTENEEWFEVAGTVGVAPGAVRLEGGQATIASPTPAPERPARGVAKTEPARNRVTAAGVLSWNAAAEFPYALKATATEDVVEAARLFAGGQAGREPVIEGRFSLASTLTSRGINLQDLVDRRQEEFHLAGKGGILRLLKVDVAQAIPDAATPVADTLAKVGTAVGYLLGIRKDSIDPGTAHLSKATEAVLDFAIQTPELRYDQFTLTAARTADHTIRLTDIAIAAAEERLTGTGEVAYVKGQPLRSRPLQLQLQLGFQGHLAQLLSTAGLLSTAKDGGYTLLRQPIRFGGTFEQIDKSQWRDLLVKAATPVPEKGKKGG